MKVKELMTENPACCTLDTALTEVAQMMVQHDCGLLPVVEEEGSQKLVGVITDRDIVCRTLAKGLDPFNMKTGDCMSGSAFAVKPNTDIQECMNLMERHLIRRIPVVDEKGNCCGIVTQADIARKAPGEKAAEVIREVSTPTDTSKAQAA